MTGTRYANLTATAEQRRAAYTSGRRAIYRERVRIAPLFDALKSAMDRDGIYFDGACLRKRAVERTVTIQ